MSKKVTIAPLYDKVVVEPKDLETKTKTGILLPDKKDKEEGIGVVVAVGKGRMTDDGKRIPLEVKKGDTVVYAKYGTEAIIVQGRSYRVLREEHILAIINE